MVFFEQLSTSLKQKWLQYYQKNRSWLVLHMTDENTVQTPDGGRRPVSYLILGILNALEPELEALMLPFSKLKADADSLIEVLGLNFDPDIAIGKKQDSSIDKSTSILSDDPQQSPGSYSPIMPDQNEDSNNWGTAAVVGGAAAVGGAAIMASGLDLESDADDLLDDDQSELDLESQVDELDMDMDSDSEVDDDLDLGIESEVDELDMDMDSDSEVDDDLDLGIESEVDELDMGLDSDSEVDDDLDLGIESEVDELDMGLDSDSEVDDDLDLGMESAAEAADDLVSLD
ncbi:DUF5331 domain-containing protein, partial [Okeania sp. SIO2B9]